MVYTSIDQVVKFGKKFTISEAIEEEEYYVKTLRTGDSMHYRWVDSTGSPVAFGRCRKPEPKPESGRDFKKEAQELAKKNLYRR